MFVFWIVGVAAECCSWMFKNVEKKLSETDTQRYFIVW